MLQVWANTENTFGKVFTGCQPASLIRVLMNETTIQDKVDSQLINNTGQLESTFLEKTKEQP